MQDLDGISKTTEWSLFVSKAKHSIITLIQVCAWTSNVEEIEIEQFYEDLQDLLELTSKKDVLFIIRDWNAKVESQEIPGVTGKFGFGVQNEAGQRLTEFCQENILVLINTLFQEHKRKLYTWTSPDGQYQNQIDYILCSQKWRAQCSQWKWDLKLIVTQIMNSLLQNSGLSWRKLGKWLGHSVMKEIKSLMIIQWSNKLVQGVKFDRLSAWRTMKKDS